MSTYTLETRLAGPQSDIKTSEQITATGELPGLAEPIAIGAADLEVIWQCDVSQVKLIIITADQDLTIETNNGTTPDNTISLKADLPYIWRMNDYNTLKLTVDVTKLYVTNGSGVATTLKIAGLYDPTV